jgi:ATP phosphoribosyltransferase regulatory subunit
VSELEKKSPISSREARLAACLVSAHFQLIEPPILQPASIFLDLSGEDIRSRLYLTSDASGAELCLRPEYTIPVCRAYLASPQAGGIAAFSYLGPVFRTRPGQPGEFRQAGLESFGRSDREAADAEILAVALGAAEAAGSGRLSIRIGDAGLFARLLDVLGLSPQWLRRLKRGFAQGQPLAAIIAVQHNGLGSEHAGVLAALEGTDSKGARALVEDLFTIAGISSVGGRSTAEIAERFLEQVSLRSGRGFPAEQREILAKFLAISGDPDDASAKMRGLAEDIGLDLTQALDAFDARANFLAARGINVAELQFSAAFGRNLDYYSGFVFEAHDPNRPDGRPVIGGGRYDGLLTALGASGPVPAVGAAIWIDRLAGALP